MGKSASSKARAGGKLPQGSEACPAPDEVVLEFPSCPEYLSLLRATAGWFAGKCGFAEKERGRIVLAVVEAVTNIIRHAYGGDEHQRITLRMAEIQGGLELELLDSGKCVPPTALKGPAKGGDSPEELRPGGLGLQMMKQCMNHVEYAPRPGGGARLVLRKLHADSPGGKLR